MRLLLDTNRYVDLASGDPEILKMVEEAIENFFPFIALAELRAGFLGGSHARQNEQKLNRFLGDRNVTVIFPDDQTTHYYATLYQQLKRQGAPIPTNDLWIAAIAIQHSLVLATRDKHFERFPQIPRI